MSNNIINRVKAKQASFNMPVNQEVTRHADGSGGPISINKQTSNQDEYKQENKGERSWYDTFSDVGHTVLDAAGFGNTFGSISIILTSANVESGAPIGGTGFTLKVGEFAFFPWDYMQDIHCGASTGSQLLEYWLFDRGA